jgi:tetratricopeptide (TPR) repeat protein
MKSNVLLTTTFVWLVALSAVASARPKAPVDAPATGQAQVHPAASAAELTAKAEAAMNAKKWKDAIDALEQLTAADPSNWRAYAALGEARYALGQYAAAGDAYAKGVVAASDAAQSSSDAKSLMTPIARLLTDLGEVELRLGKSDDAVAAFQKAVGLDPTDGGAYFNLCATQYNTGRMDGALEACDKAIAIDPSRADAYFIKGSVLVAASRASHAAAPPDGVAALETYLELAPHGPHAADVRSMLARAR